MALKPLKNESELLAKIALGDERAFTELFDHYYQNLGVYVFKIIGSETLAEEIVQDIFFKVWLKREALLEVRNFSNYLFILSRNRTYDELQKQATERSFLERLNQRLQDDEKNKSLDVDEGSFRELLDAAIDKLPPQAQRVYLMSRDERMKYEEIALALEISPITVKKHIQYANKFIANELGKKLNVLIAALLMTHLILPK